MRDAVCPKFDFEEIPNKDEKAIVLYEPESDTVEKSANNRQELGIERR